MDPWIAQQAKLIADRAETDLRGLVAVSSHHGDLVGAERMVQALLPLTPDGCDVQRLPSSMDGFAPDLLVTLEGTGEGRLLLVGHLDTVIPGKHLRELEVIGDVWHGSGTFDMKGGLVIACGVMRALAQRPELFSEIRLLVLCDEEGRAVPLRHRDAPWAQADACLCFEGGEAHNGHDAVVVRRKAAASLTVRAYGQAAHAGASVKEGVSALEALATLVKRLTVFAIDGDEEVSVTPTQLQAGEAINIVPATGWMHCDVRAFSSQTVRNMLALVPHELGGVRLEAELDERFPGMDSRAAAKPLLEASAQLLGRPLLGIQRGGSADASYFAERIPATVDGLGPVGGGDHAPHEHVLGSSFAPRSEVALAFALAALFRPPVDPLADLSWVRDISA